MAIPALQSMTLLRRHIAPRPGQPCVLWFHSTVASPLRIA